MQHGQTLRVVGLLTLFDTSEHKLLGLGRTLRSHIDARQRVERGAHGVGIATPTVNLVALLGIVGSLVVVGQTNKGDGQKVQTVALAHTVITFLI